jgi:hypothetical protein
MAENKIEKICNQYLSSAAPTFSKLADFYISNRTCYSTVPPPVDEKRDGKWHYSTCPNCKNARVNQTNKKKKDGVKRKEPEDSSHVSSSSQGDALRQTQQQQQQQIQQLLFLFAQHQQLQLQQQQRAPQPPAFVAPQPRSLPQHRGGAQMHPPPPRQAPPPQSSSRPAATAAPAAPASTAVPRSPSTVAAVAPSTPSVSLPSPQLPAAAPAPAINTLQVYVKAEREISRNVVLFRGQSTSRTSGSSASSYANAFSQASARVQGIVLGIDDARIRASTSSSQGTKLGTVFEMTDVPNSYLLLGESKGEAKSGGFGECTASEFIIFEKKASSGYKVTKHIWMLKRPRSLEYPLRHEATMLFYANGVQAELQKQRTTSFYHPTLDSNMCALPYVVPIFHYLPSNVSSTSSAATTDGILEEAYDSSLRTLLVDDLKTDVDKLKVITRLAAVLRFFSVQCTCVRGSGPLCVSVLYPLCIHCVSISVSMFIYIALYVLYIFLYVEIEINRRVRLLIKVLTYSKCVQHTPAFFRRSAGPRRFSRRTSPRQIWGG